MGGLEKTVKVATCFTRWCTRLSSSSNSPTQPTTWPSSEEPTSRRPSLLELSRDLAASEETATPPAARARRTETVDLMMERMVVTMLHLPLLPLLHPPPPLHHHLHQPPRHMLPPPQLLQFTSPPLSSTDPSQLQLLSSTGRPPRLSTSPSPLLTSLPPPMSTPTLTCPQSTTGSMPSRTTTPATTSAPRRTGTATSPTECTSLPSLTVGSRPSPTPWTAEMATCPWWSTPERLSIPPRSLPTPPRRSSRLPGGRRSSLRAQQQFNASAIVAVIYPRNSYNLFIYLYQI